MARIYEPQPWISPQEIVAEQRKEFTYIGAQRRIPGLTLYEYDLTTGELRKADMRTEAEFHLDGTVNRSSKVDSKELCLYVQALNEANALKKVRQLIRRKSVQKKILNNQ